MENIILSLTHLSNSEKIFSTLFVIICLNWKFLLHSIYFFNFLSVRTK